MTRLRGVHPRLVTQPPDTRASLAILPPLKGLGDEFAWAVWYSVRKAHAPAERSVLPAQDVEWIRSLFHSAAESVPSLSAELEVLCLFVCGEANSRSAADTLGNVAEWAGSKGLIEPAIQCAEAAAALAPESSVRAVEAGRSNRFYGAQVSRADLYYERAIPLARQARNWRCYVRAHLGKGQVKKSLGDTLAARAHYYTAARAARWLSGEKWLAGQTHHDLLDVAAEEGAFDEALYYADQALECYPRHHSRIPALVHDFGFLLLRMQLFGHAVPLVTRVMRCVSHPQDQVIGWSTLAHAAAGLNDEATYRAAADNTLRLVAMYDLHGAAAFANLAGGAHLLGQWDDAEQYARRCLQIAEQRRQAEAVPVAKEILANLGGRHPWYLDTPLSEHVIAQVARLVPLMMERLAGWRGPTWRPRRPDRDEQSGSS